MLISRENILNRLNLSFKNNDVILSNSENLPRVLEIEEGSVSLNCKSIYSSLSINYFDIIIIVVFSFNLM